MITIIYIFDFVLNHQVLHESAMSNKKNWIYHSEFTCIIEHRILTVDIHCHPIHLLLPHYSGHAASYFNSLFLIKKIALQKIYYLFCVIQLSQHEAITLCLQHEILQHG